MKPYTLISRSLIHPLTHSLLQLDDLINLFFSFLTQVTSANTPQVTPLSHSQTNQQLDSINSDGDPSHSAGPAGCVCLSCATNPKTTTCS